jgi:hypothetical protein
MLKLLIANSAGTVDITQLVQSITWSGDYQQCARTLEFGLVSSPRDKNVPAVECELGNGVVFMQDNRVLFDGYIFERQKSTGSSVINITCYDRGIYLKRNEAVYKFTNMTPEAIAKRVCSDFGITIGSLAATGIKITRNFIGVSLYKIIQTAYTLASEKTGEKYMIRFDGAKMSVIKKTVTDETLVIEGGSNLMSASTTESIANMINQVAIYNTDDQLVGKQKDAEAIKLYGVMQSYLKQSDGEDATEKAKKLISDNGISQKITIENLGNIANITGGTVVVREPYTGIYGLFYIDSDVHTWKLGQYYNKLVVNFKNIMDEQEVGSLPNKTGNKTASSSKNNSTWTYLYKPGGG